jgi:dihydroxyacetone kinase
MEMPSRTGPGRGRDDLLREIAERYWMRGETQEEIGRILSYSRVTISRMRDARLERALRSLLGIDDVRVALTEPRRGATNLVRFADCASRAVQESLAAGGVLAVASSRTVLPVAEAVRSLPAAAIVVEALGHPLRSGLSAAGLLAASAGASFTGLDAAFVHRTRERAEAARRRESVRKAIELAERSDAILFGIGTIDRFDGTGAVSPLSARQLEELRRRGAVGHVAGHFIDRDGRPLASELDERRVGIGLDALSAVPSRLLVARGSDRAAAVRAAARGGLMTTLVTDDALAKAVAREA